MEFVGMIVDYFSFAGSTWFLRGLAVLVMLWDLLIIYLTVFDRVKLRRFATGFLSAISGLEIRNPPPEEEPPVPLINWIGFWILCAIPPAIWIVVEIYVM